MPEKTTKIKHDIELLYSCQKKTCKQHPYRVGPVKQAALDNEVQKMLDIDVIEECKEVSSWSSPCILVPKADKSYQFVTDFRRVNEVTKTDTYPIPRVDDCIDKVGKAVFVSKFDLMKGYWQIPLTGRAKEISTFVTSKGSFSYKVMPFGLKKIHSQNEKSQHETA